LLNGVARIGDAAQGPIAPSVGDRFRAEYAEDLTLDPVVGAARVLLPGEVGRADELVSLDDLRRTRFASDWLAPQKLIPTRSLIARLDGEQPLAFLRLFWPCGTRPQLERSKRELSRLVEPLRQAIRTSQRLADLDAVRAGLQTVVDGVPIAFLLVDLDGRILTTNSAANRLLARRDGLVADRDGLRGSTCEGTREIRRLLRAAQTESGNAGRAATRIPRPAGRAPLHAIAQALRSGPASLVALLVGNPETEPELPTDLLQRFHQLTPAEAALARVLAQGHDLGEAAAALGITRQTVRSRLRDVFAKTGTSRQAALVERLLASPAFFHAAR
jgi:DNA-binding CsgD family transcriptional regulator